jgi:hypothetical protein
MKEFKSPVSRLAKLFKKSRDAWKGKALEKQQRLRAAQVKVRDLEQSREQWKKRALEAEEALAGTAEAPEKASAAPESGVEEHREMSPPAGHHYRLMEMQLVIGMYLDAGVGSRGVGRVLELIGGYFPVAAPAYTTVLNWVYRCGVHILNRAVERRTDWIFVADHTIALGQAKCLVILGIPASELPHTGYSPSHRDMQVLAVEVTPHSTGAWVAEVLDRVCQRVGPPVQIVADQGSDLYKGIELFQQHSSATVYTYDISHRIATLFKAELGQDARWNAFLGHCRDSLAGFQQTDLAFLRPPRQRTKARFMHVDAHIEWAQRLLAYHDRGDFSAIEARFSLDWSRWQALVEQFGPEPTLALRPLIATPYPSQAAFRQALEAVLGPAVERIEPAFWHHADAGRRRFLEGFGWLLDYRQDLADYAQLIAQSKAIQFYLKTEGLQKNARQALEQHLDPLSTLAPRVAKLTEQILDHVEMESAKLPDNTTGLASSDIIESVFGKYKHFTAKGPLKEIGKLVLAIPAFVSDLSTHLIKEAMESVRTVDVDDWVRTHLGPSMLAKRKQALTPLVGDTKSA